MPTLFIRDVHRCKQECKNLLSCLEARRTKRMDTDTVAGRLVKHVHLRHFCSSSLARSHKSEKIKHDIAHRRRLISSHASTILHNMSYIIHKKNRVHCECVGLLSTEKGQCWQGLENEGKKHQLRKTRGHKITTEEPRYNSSISHENTFVTQ